LSTKTSDSPLPVYTVKRLNYPNPENTIKSHNCSYSISTLTPDYEFPSPPPKQACNCNYRLSPPLYSISNHQKYDLESHCLERSKSIVNDRDIHGLPIRQCTCTGTGASSPTSPTSTHQTLVGQVIDIKRNTTADEQEPGLTTALPEIDESDAFTISSFSYYEDSVFPGPGVFQPTASTVAPSTPPHPPSPRFLPPQHSLPPPPTRKQPRAVGSLSSLVSGHVETNRYSRESFSFHNSRHPHRRSNPFARSPLQHETWRPVSYPISPLESLAQDVPEDVGPCSYTRPPGMLAGLPEREEFTPDYLPLMRKKSVLGIEGGEIQVVVERSASVDGDRTV